MLGRGALGLGVPTSLLLAILVLALANSSRSVWGISGSKRMPCGKEQGSRGQLALISWWDAAGIRDVPPFKKAIWTKSLRFCPNIPMGCWGGRDLMRLAASMAPQLTFL